MAVRSHFSNDFFRLVLHIHISKIFADGSCDASGTLGGFRMGGRGMKINPAQLNSDLVVGSCFTWYYTSLFIAEENYSYKL